MLADGDYLSLSLFLFLYYSVIVDVTEAVAIFFVDKIENSYYFVLKFYIRILISINSTNRRFLNNGVFLGRFCDDRFGTME